MSLLYPSFKLLALFITAATHYLSTSPPIPPPGPEDEVYSGHSFDKVLPLLRFGSMTALSMALVSEFITVASVAYPTRLHFVPPTVYTALCPRGSPDPVALQSIPPLFWLGLALVITGCALRVWCYKVLGRLFTYEVTVRPAHTLITGAPYSVVRHPSYTGLFMHFTGVAVLHFAPGSWNRECGIMHTASKPWIMLWLALSFYTFVSVWRRGSVEDDIMRKRFGIVWEHYRDNVPARFFPGLI